MVRISYMSEVDSTNDEIMRSDDRAGYERIFLFAARQTAGRGQRGNKWESESGKNITFSLYFRPEGVKADEQFAISMAVAVVMTKIIRPYVGRAKVKWPNDIYVGDKKIAGILIENRLKGNQLSECVVGIGLNVNQTRFRSDAPNPVSIKQITDVEVDLHRLERRIVRMFGKMIDSRQYVLTPWLKREYMSRLYRHVGYHRYADDAGEFEARIIDVEPSGQIVLKDLQRRIRSYAFKEVRAIL